MTETILAVDIRTDGGTQPRAAIKMDVVREYAEAMAEGATFPPVTVYYDGSDYWLADGFHRVAAAKRIGTVELEAEIRQGTRRDAILHSVGANAQHGLRRTNADKRRAVMALLNDEEWRQWSDREIARRCGVHNSFVSRIRSSLSTGDSEPRTYTTKHGTTATMKTRNIGRKQEPPKAQQPWYDAEEDAPEPSKPEPQREGQPTARKSAVTGPIFDSSERPVFLIVDYVDRVLEGVESNPVKHEIVNTVIKRLRALSVRMNQEASA
jgi:hypothetical protein